MKIILSSLAIVLLAAFPVFAGPSKKEADKKQTEAVVQKLIASVAKSDAIFIRNGSEHKGKEAADHMQAKYDHFKKEIDTPEKFIEKCASKSILSGKPYMVRTSDGKEIKCEDWLREKLKTMEADAKNPEKK